MPTGKEGLTTHMVAAFPKGLGPEVSARGLPRAWPNWMEKGIAPEKQHQQRNTEKWQLHSGSLLEPQHRWETEWPAVQPG